MPSGILASRRNPEEIFIYFNFNSTNFYLSRPDPIFRFDPNFGGFFRPGSNSTEY